MRKLVLLTLLLVGTALAGPIYMYSSAAGEPWGSTSIDTAMNTVFGAGNWSVANYETADPAVLLSAANGFIFMEGGNYGDSPLQLFLNSNIAAIQSWVNAGGRLIIESAGNSTGVVTPFGVTLLWDASYDIASSNGYAAISSHPIFNGPYTPVGTSWWGNSFSHDVLSGGTFTTLINGDSGPVLGELLYGLGLVLISGMTTNNWQGPSPEVQNLTANRIYYGAGVPEPVTFALAGAALLALGLLRRARN